jgi:hypothetical protein
VRSTTSRSSTTADRRGPTALAVVVGFTLLLLLGVPAAAQHQGHHPDPEPAEPAEAQTDTGRHLYQSDMALMAGRTAQHEAPAPPGWTWMVTGVGRLVLNDQGGPSGDRDLESTNWNMVMGHHGLGPGRLTLMLMNSLEPQTVDEAGSPQLFQTGETFEGQPLVDHQHAHDFFMNLSATWRLPLGDASAAWVQLAPVGEPALGPTAFMHRASSGENPSAPLGHHWQDSTHITNNVLTLGGGHGPWTLEASVFHGAEPDDQRWDLEGGELDSFSGRLHLRLGRGWSAQVSSGRLEQPEQLVPGDVTRTTASVHYGAEGDRPFAASAVWGRNDEEHGVSDSFLLEAAYAATRSDHVFGRAEYVDKDEQLLATKDLPPEGQPVELAAIRALTLGYLRAIHVPGRVETGVAVDVTVYDYPGALDDAYGDSPAAVHLFVRLRWTVGSGGAPHAHG